MSIAERFGSFFRDEPDEQIDEQVAQQASALLEWLDLPQTREFVGRLDREARKPVPVGAQLLEGAIRSNTYREIVSEIDQRRGNAQRVLESVARRLHGT